MRLPPPSVFILLLAVLAGLVWWRERKTSPPPLSPPDELTELMTSLRQATGLAFSPLQEAELTWNLSNNCSPQATPSAQVSFKGLSFSVDNLSLEEQSRIGTFLEERGFGPDLANMENGVTTGRTAYTKDDVACLHLGQLLEGSQPEEPRFKAEVQCARLTTSPPTP